MVSPLGNIPVEAYGTAVIPQVPKSFNRRELTWACSQSLTNRQSMISWASSADVPGRNGNRIWSRRPIDVGSPMRCKQQWYEYNSWTASTNVFGRSVEIFFILVSICLREINYFALNLNIFRKTVNGSFGNQNLSQVKSKALPLYVCYYPLCWKLSLY